MFPERFEEEPSEEELKRFCINNTLMANNMSEIELFAHCANKTVWIEADLLRTEPYRKELPIVCCSAAIQSDPNADDDWIVVTDKWKVGFETQAEAMLWKLGH